MDKEIIEYINAKKNPISHCVDLTKYFIGRHKELPVYLTRAFEQEFNSSMYELEELRNKLKKKDEVIKKAVEYIKNELLVYDNESDEHLVGINLLQILEYKEV